MTDAAPTSHCIDLFHDEALFRSGQVAKHFYLVKTGAIFILDDSGTIANQRFFAGELFGVPEVLARSNWHNTAVAFGRTSLTAFGAESLFRSLDVMPSKHRDFIRHIASMN